MDHTKWMVWLVNLDSVLYTHMTSDRFSKNLHWHFSNGAHLWSCSREWQRDKVYECIKSKIQYIYLCVLIKAHIREIEGFATHICVTREMRAVFHDAYMRHQAKMTYLILAWCRIYASWKTALISLVTHICVANPSISLIVPGGDLQNSVRPRWQDYYSNLAVFCRK